MKTCITAIVLDVGGLCLLRVIGISQFQIHFHDVSNDYKTF